MRTYTAFGLLALASTSALSAPTSPDLSRDLSVPATAPNSPDPSNNGEMAAFPSFSALDLDSLSDVQDLPSSVTGMTDGPAKTHMSYPEYEQWLQSQKSVPASRDAKSFTVPTSETAKSFAVSPDQSSDSGSTTTTSSGPDGVERLGQELSPNDSQGREPRTFLALGQRDLLPAKSNVTDTKTLPAKLAKPDATSLPANVNENNSKTISEQEQKHKDVLKKLAPARLKNPKRELPVAVDRMHMNHTHAEAPNLPTRPKQVAALTRRLRRATLSELPALSGSAKHANGKGLSSTTLGIHRILRTNGSSPLACSEQ